MSAPSNDGKTAFPPIEVTCGAILTDAASVFDAAVTELFRSAGVRRMGIGFLPRRWNVLLRHGGPVFGGFAIPRLLCTNARTVCQHTS